MKFARSIEIRATILRTRVALRFWPERELSYALRDSGSDIHPMSAALAREFQSATRSMARGRCLLLSVACIRFLRRRGLPASLRVGFTPGFHGHAWVDCEAQYSSRFGVFNFSPVGLAELIANRRTI